uniref:Oxidoreductase molybdopterin-binding domain-containing protein n=2 Tax=Aplanochytrium stocchinoi TaxID=215587 RepID=A0A7S3PJ36_9STRA|mmetsp:Transcript_22085/g.26954  ORF Transcript_22085/g.26954 Transcript_22085/m.26954 type:complete len:373 (+) Transcript_22085:222-1340(+)|eukprot:CAMPEP_0204842136 /NCGR_PEP_ID=MMETSP1346-20131115/44858_1 /ASSEMBLY_ACC=CAM_ASM_000771 /TAXON_ID=215587 /ORGANISM="Aplanochytrium stocchinoi, Strain GSBS06" /LENGTH=372 /DNA_ID=CAMNT_0051980709 /DNA_START=156 /DNA_END=1274 /DNA_ORIENTATION=-
MALFEFIAFSLVGTVVFFVWMAATLLFVGKGDLDVSKYRYGDIDKIKTLETDDKVQKKIAQKLKLRDKALANIKSPLSATSMETVNKNKYGLPEGQIPSKTWIVLDLGKRPTEKDYNYSQDREGNIPNWSLAFTLNGSSNHNGVDVNINLKDLQEIGLHTYTNVQWNCVTGWTYSNISFQGVPFAGLIDFVEKRFRQNYDNSQNFQNSSVKDENNEAKLWDPDWRYLYQTSPEGYSVPVFREDTADAFLCVYFKTDGDENYRLVDFEHGGIRFVFPSLFGWKSCKWVTKVDLAVEYKKGFWERIGCHARGRVKYNERWAPQASKFWKFLAGSNSTFLSVFGQSIGTFVMQKSGFYLGFCVDTIKYVFKLKND